MSGVIRLQDIEGLVPSVDPTRSDRLYILGGRNYTLDAKGARSSFGNRLLTPIPTRNAAHIQGFRAQLRHEILAPHITSDSISVWDESLGGYRIIYRTPDTSLRPYRWSYGYLNGKLYMCHPATGILVYDTETRFCQPHRGPGVPSNPLWIVVDNGCLIVVTPTHFYWSAPSDGMDFAPALGGAGFQLIQERVSGTPIMVTSYAQGCLTWTTGGVMRSEFTGDAAVYRHRALQTEYQPVNPFCAVRIDDSTTVVLDRRGLFQSKGDSPVPLSPLFNEFLAGFIQTHNLQIGQNARLEWDDLRRHLYVSLSLSYGSAIYEHCFVLYTNLDKWGQFSEPHYGILPVNISGSTREGDYFGFVDSKGHVRYWTLDSSCEATPTQANHLTHNLYRPRIQKPTHVERESGAITVSSSGMLNSSQLTVKANLRESYYDNPLDAPVAPILTGLDAEIAIGLYRPAPGDSVDRAAEVVNVLVRSGLTGPTNYATVDGFLTNENFGLDRVYSSDHQLRIVATNDGVSPIDSIEPTLVEKLQAAHYYTCSIVGVWFIVQFKASEVGEYFYPTTLEFTAIDAGRVL